MKTLSGVVAIVREGVVVGFRDLGPRPVEVKEDVLPVEDRVVNTAMLRDPMTAVTLEVSASSVIRTTTTRDRTAPETAAENDRAIDAVDRVTIRVLFTHENRTRALEGKAAVTMNQFRTALRALL